MPLHNSDMIHAKLYYITSYYYILL